MQVAAIVVVGERASFADAPEYDGLFTGDLDEPEWFAGSPIVALELLGQSALERMVAHLRIVGAQSISLVTKETLLHMTTGLSACRTVSVPVEPASSPWPAIGSLVDEYATNGFDTILLIRLGAYLEFNFSDFLQFHRASGQALTRASAPDGPLDFWMIDGKHFREAGVCFHEEKCTAAKAGAEYYQGATHINRLRDARDIRRMVVDGLEMRLAFRPSGKEIRPGVWVDDHSRLHQRARIEGPVYIGREARIGDTAFVSALSNVERYSHIDDGTSIADASILAHTNLGAWLGVSQTVICGNRLANLRHNVTVEIQDDRLVKHTSSFVAGRSTSPSVVKPAGWQEITPDVVLKPQRSMMRAARALFLTKRTQ